MKVLFLNLPTHDGTSFIREGRCMQKRDTWTTVWPPISLVLMATIAEGEGAWVKVTDCSVEDMDFNSLDRQIDTFEPDLTIINTATATINSDLAFASSIKKRLPDSKVGAFGIHVSALPEESFAMNNALDFIIRGEPEETIKHLVVSMKNGHGLKEVEGISFRQSGRIIHNRPRQWITDLDSLPYPNWDLVKYLDYRLPLNRRPFLFVATGRGCPYHCIYCTQKTYYGSAYRPRSPRRVVDELTWLCSRYGVRDFVLWSETFTLNHKYVAELCGLIRKDNLKINWSCTTRVDLVNPGLLHEMKQAGCWLIAFGIESGSQRILDNTGKGHSVESSKAAVKMAKEAGLLVVGHFILGLPGEDKNSLMETMRLISQLNIDFAQFYCAVPFPGSPLYDLAMKEGWIVSKDWSTFEQSVYNMRLGDVTPEVIYQYRKKAIRKFYLRPSKVISNLRRLTEPDILRNSHRLALEFLRRI